MPKMRKTGGQISNTPKKQESADNKPQPQQQAEGGLNRQAEGGLNRQDKRANNGIENEIFAIIVELESIVFK